MGKFWRLIGKGLGWVVRNPEAIAGAKEMWGELRKGPAKPPTAPVERLCPATHDTLACTLPANHDGPHIAVGTNPLVVWR